MKRTRVAGGVIVSENTGLVVIVSQNGDSWSLPKGHVEAGEDELTAAIREIREESGVTDLRFKGPLGEYQRHRIGKDGKGEVTDELKNIMMFLFTTPQETLAPEDPKNPEARWVDRKDVAALLTHQKDREFFLGVIDRLPT
jgi:ADP-ribose pyrophosphatase YjhB (NUDIX family)